ncbi:MAG: PEGA domain-containing protein, partial [Deltaproteobacteria bacterium]|nr:PEGA domain-containing protein [Deltaproteobacteria bacterium]
LLLLLTVSLPAAALPQGAPTLAGRPGSKVKSARDLFEAAERLYRQKKYAAAVVKFEEAQAFRPHPVVMFNIARCREQLGEAAAALRWYREHLRVAEGEKDQEQVLQAVVRLERKLREQGVQQLTALTEPPGARVEINGRELGAAPVTTELAEGEHTVSVSAPGHEPTQQRHAYQLLRATDLRISLARTPEPAPVAEPAPAPQPAPEAAVMAATPESPPAQSGMEFKWIAGGSGRLHRLGLWPQRAGGAALAGAGTGAPGAVRGAGAP